MRVLITGIYGQDGRILSKIYKKKGHKVYGFVKEKKKIENLFYQSTVEKIFVNNLINLPKVIFDLNIIKPNLIIHLAANNADAGKENNFFKYYFLNIFFFINIFFSYLLFHKEAKFLLAGSAMMYQKNNLNFIDENSEFLPMNYYGKYKVHAHKIMVYFKKIFKLKCTTLILFNHDSKYRNQSFLYPRIIKSLLKKDTLSLKKIIKKNLFLDLSHAEDICNLIYNISSSKKNFDKLILSSGKFSSVNKIIKPYFKKKNYFKKNIKPTYGLVGDNNLVKKEYNFSNKKNSSIAFKEILNKIKFLNKA